MRTTTFCKIFTIILISIAILVLPCYCFALEITPKVIELGDVSPDKTFKETITIKNNESKTIILEKARSSCDCVTIEYEKNKKIKKQEIYILNIRINTEGLDRKNLRKFIFLQFRNSKTPIISVEIMRSQVP